MHDVVLYVASLWMAGLLGAALWFTLRVRSPLSRILALDTLVLVLVALLAAFGASRESPYLLDAALALAALSFTGTLALARLHGEDRPFR